MTCLGTFRNPITILQLTASMKYSDDIVSSQNDQIEQKYNATKLIRFYSSLAVEFKMKTNAA